MTDPTMLPVSPDDMVGILQRKTLHLRNGLASGAAPKAIRAHIEDMYRVAVALDDAVGDIPQEHPADANGEAGAN